MAEPGSRRGRAHDAEGAREAILNAAEEVFAEHGFDGARIDAIAAAAGYNKSLIFQYYGDKLGLYAEVVRRADRQMSGMQEQMLALVGGDEAAGMGTYRRLVAQELMHAMAGEDGRVTTGHRLEVLLRTFISEFLDYLLEHPRIGRIFLWEMAEGWQTFAKIVSQRDIADVDRLRPFIREVHSARVLRSDVDPIVQLIVAEFLCVYYLALIPLFYMVLPGEDLSSSAAQARAREFIVEFVVHGMMADAAEVRS